MFNLFKKKEEPKKLAITYRIKEIYKKLQLIDKCKYNINYNFCSIWHRLDTDLGRRSILCSETSLSYYNENNEKLFELDIYDSGTKVQLQPFSIKLTYNEIDLAILEFEKAITVQYHNCLNQLEYHKKLTQKFYEA